MPIPLGVLAVAGAGGGAAGAYEWLETQVLGTAVATVTFSNLSTSYSATYQHLQIRMTAKTARNDVADVLRIKPNGSSLTRSHGLQGAGVSVQSVSEADFRIGWIAGNTNADRYGAAVIDILDAFKTTKNKTIRTLSGFNNGASGGESVISLTSGFLDSTSTLSSLELSAIANFNIGSRFSLYGLRSS